MSIPNAMACSCLNHFLSSSVQAAHLLIWAPVFSLTLICHEASSAALTNQEKVHLATTAAPGATTHLFRKLLLSSNGIRFSFETLVSYYPWASLCMQRYSFQDRCGICQSRSMKYSKTEVSKMKNDVLWKT